jgi:predicted acetyltransferase
MNLVLEEAKIEQKGIIENLLELYNYDFTEFVPDDVDNEGRFGYDPLKYYWNESGRYVFIVKVDLHIAGFVMVRTIKEDLSAPIFSMAEFFIMKKYRMKGIGTTVAAKIFSMLKGEWEVAEIEENIPAQKFWRKAINDYTKGNFIEIEKSDWKGPVQRFNSLG